MKSNIKEGTAIYIKNFMKPKYRIIENLSDVAVEAWGNSPEELFAYMGQGMFAVMTDSRILARDSYKISIREDCGSSYEEAMVAWCNELIYQFETSKVLFSRFNINKLALQKNTQIEAEVWGEPFDQNKHEIKVAIKAATYHQLKIEQNGQWRCQLIFDI